MTRILSQRLDKMKKKEKKSRNWMKRKTRAARVCVCVCIDARNSGIATKLNDVACLIQAARSLYGIRQIRLLSRYSYRRTMCAIRIDGDIPTSIFEFHAIKKFTEFMHEDLVHLRRLYLLVVVCHMCGAHTKTPSRHTCPVHRGCGVVSYRMQNVSNEMP